QHQNVWKRCSAFANRIFRATDPLAPSADSTDLDRRIVCPALVSAVKGLPVPWLVLLDFLHGVCGAQGKELLPRAYLPDAICCRGDRSGKRNSASPAGLVETGHTGVVARRRSMVCTARCPCTPNRSFYCLHGHAALSGAAQLALSHEHSA